MGKNIIWTFILSGQTNCFCGYILQRRTSVLWAKTRKYTGESRQKSFHHFQVLWFEWSQLPGAFFIWMVRENGISHHKLLETAKYLWINAKTDTASLFRKLADLEGNEFSSKSLAPFISTLSDDDDELIIMKDFFGPAGLPGAKLGFQTSVEVSRQDKVQARSTVFFQVRSWLIFLVFFPRQWETLIAHVIK